ncbi:C40 family peptidase [Brachybacterium tyrofermentans]|uniref:C40 family peptidase n=1 Tax=Brachybacterium tyrofermentans TaxID=47848 RepID=UPI003FD029F0
MSESPTDDPSGGSKGLVIALIFAVVAGIIIAPVGLVMLLAEDEEESATGTGTCTAPNGGQALAVVDTGTLPLVPGFLPEQIGVAATIMNVAEEQGLGADAQLIGLITAMQESTLGINTYATGAGDAGPFQQRTLDGWYGSLEDVMNPSYAATVFFTGVTADSPGDYGSVGGGAGNGHIPGLIDITGWETMPPGEAAQAVQRSAYPDEYQGHVPEAQTIMSSLSGVDVNIDASACAEPAASGDMAAAIERGRSILGTPYVFGDGDVNGPGSSGGIDCSGFVMYALAAAGVTDLPRVTQQQFDYLAASPVAVDDIQPGDLIFEAWGRTGEIGNPAAISHVTMYIGDGQVIEASRSAMEVKTSPTRFEVDAFVGIRRPAPANTN